MSFVGTTGVTNAMSPAYLTLAKQRRAASCQPHKHPEDFGYDFSSWVSPYTIGAHACGGVAVVLQDWASVKGLSKQFNPDIQLYGRTPDLLTNVRLESFLRSVLGLKLSEVYATNAFPFVKAGSMSAALKRSDVARAAQMFLSRELELVQPTTVLALGSVAHYALVACGRTCIRLPHPAARIGSTASHEAVWRATLSSTGILIRKAEPDCGA